MFSAFPVFVFFSIQNVMPLSAGLLRSQRRNATAQCPPRFQVQHLNAVSWTRVPDCALKVMVDRPDERHGWRVQCQEPLQVMTIQIPDENRLTSWNKYVFLELGLQFIISSTRAFNLILGKQQHLNSLYFLMTYV